jgi:hypothetical protein
MLLAAAGSSRQDNKGGVVTAVVLHASFVSLHQVVRSANKHTG